MKIQEYLFYKTANDCFSLNSKVSNKNAIAILR